VQKAGKGQILKKLIKKQTIVFTTRILIETLEEFPNMSLKTNTPLDLLDP
jgi:predicted metal-dependent HD superfamily phosphohydrolase